MHALAEACEGNSNPLSLRHSTEVFPYKQKNTVLNITKIHQLQACNASD